MLMWKIAVIYPYIVYIYIICDGSSARREISCVEYTDLETHIWLWGRWGWCDSPLTQKWPQRQHFSFSENELDVLILTSSTDNRVNQFISTAVELTCVQTRTALTLCHTWSIIIIERNHQSTGVWCMITSHFVIIHLWSQIRQHNVNYCTQWCN